MITVSCSALPIVSCFLSRSLKKVDVWVIDKGAFAVRVAYLDDFMSFFHISKGYFECDR